MKPDRSHMDDLNVALYEWAMLGYSLEYCYMPLVFIQDMYAFKHKPSDWPDQMQYWHPAGSAIIFPLTPLMLKAYERSKNAQINSDIQSS